MSTVLTLGLLRVEIGVSLGESDPLTGTITTDPISIALVDGNRFDSDGYWDNGWFQDTTNTSYPVGRIQQWTLGNSTFLMYQPLAGVVTGDSYEIHRLFSFGELRRIINRGLAMAGPSLRNIVRDETQTLIAGTYQYKPNYNATSINQFFQQGVFKIEVQYYTGLPTAPWLELTDWGYLDDETIQFSQDSVDAYAGNPVRFTGYGPLCGRITTDTPTQVLGSFDDDSSAEILIWACCHHAWKLLSAKQTANERSSSEQNAQDTLQLFHDAVKGWRRPDTFKRMVIAPMQPGWTGYGAGGY